MNYDPLEGLIAAPFTPMNQDGTINPDIIPAYYRFLKHNRITGAFICGSTGEGVSMSTLEKKHIAKAWADCTNHDKDFKVMLFLGGTSLTDCKELATYAQELGLYAVSFTAPFYFKPANATMLAEACAEIAAVVPQMPFYYYHIPVLTGVNFPMLDLLKAVDGKIPNFAGVKYTHEDFMDFLSCMNFKAKKYDMLWGRDENLLPALALGTKGCVGSTFNYAAPLYYELIDAFKNGNLQKSQELQQKSIDMITLLGKYGGIATGKAYMKLVGLNLGKFRLPVKNMDEKQFQVFTDEVASLNFDTFNSNAPDVA